MGIGRWLPSCAALLVAWWGTSAAAAPPAAVPLPDDEVPLAPDPSLVRGALANGVGYWIAPHPAAAGRAVVWMRVAAGSLDEGNDEQGLAHFAEHMAFRGTRNYPHGAVLQRLGAMGLAIGTDENAVTTLRATTYKLALPRASDDALAEAMRMMADFAYRRDPSPADVARERRVIEAEMLEADGYRERVDGRVFAAALAGARAAERLPLGDAQVIATAGPRELDRFLARWYRPERTTVIVAGDVDPSAVIALVEREFGSFRARTPPPVEPPALAAAAAAPAGSRAARAVVVTDPEQPFAEIRLVRTEAARPARTVGDFRRALAERLALSMLNRRLRDAEDGGAPFEQAYAEIEPGVDGAVEQAAVYGFAPAGSWRGLLGALVVRLEGAVQRGFAVGELERARSEVLSELRTRAAGAGTRPAEALATELCAALGGGQTALAPAERLRLAEALAPAVGLADVDAALRARFAGTGRLLAVILPARASLSVPTRAQVTRVAARAARGTGVGAPATVERPQRPLDALLDGEPEPGDVVEEARDEASGVTSVLLSNGVRVHLRSMPERQDEVRVQLTLAGGELLETAATRGLSEAAALAFDAPATTSLSAVAIRAPLAGRDIDLSGCACDGDGITAELVTGQADLEKGMRLLYLVLTRGRVTPAALAAWKDRDREWAAREASDPELRVDAELAADAAGGDARARPLTPEQIARVDVGAAQAWFDRHRASAPLEAALVGDAPLDELVRLARKYLGALPTRVPGAWPALAPLRQPQVHMTAMATNLPVDGVTPRAALALAWRGPETGARADRDRLELAAAVLTERLHQELRERRGLTYAVFFKVTPAVALRGTGTMTASLSTDPRRAREALRLARQVVERFASAGPTPDELAAARRQVESRRATDAASPSAWADRLSALELRGEDASALDTPPGALNAVTAEEVRAAVAHYVSAARPLSLVAMPAWNLALGARSAGAPMR